MEKIKRWIHHHPDAWEFILFNLLSNCATATNFVVMWMGTGLLFRGLAGIPFRFLIFDYTDTSSSLGLGGFLSFLTATASAQTVNFFVQKNFVFKSNAAFHQAVPKYIALAVLLIIVSVALPAYSQALLIGMGVFKGVVPTLANLINIVVQVVISYPLMKFWIMKQ